VAQAIEPTSTKNYLDIPGWFYWYDRALFDTILKAQDFTGDIVELGAYLGRSSVILGNHIRSGERFVVVDLFGAEASDSANKQENERSYRTLNREQFEGNYLAFHSELPEVIQGFSSEVMAYVKPNTVRFLHVDASHLYDQVAEDIRNAQTLLEQNGVVVLDDFRSGHTPGVAAATWEAVLGRGLKPFATSKLKMYATWGDADFYRRVVKDLLKTDKRLGHLVHEVKGQTIVQVYAAKRPAEPAHTRSAPSKPQAEPAAPPKQSKPRERKQPAPRPATLAGRVRHVIARDIAPPALTRWVRRRKAAKPSGRPQ
jgi:hypothetical protein